MPRIDIICLRLGGGPEDAEAVKSHQFFAAINWTDLEKRRVTPPWKPQVDRKIDRHT